jgi:rod shape determining protein RodA
MRSISDSVQRLGSAAEPKSGLRGLAHVRWGLAVAGLLLALVGLITIHSASSELAGDYTARQSIWLVVSVLCGAIAFLFDDRFLVRMGPILYGVSLGLLTLVLVIGDVAGGARSWFELGPIRFQPSEFAKLATVLLLSWYLGGLHQKHLNLRQLMLTAIIVLAPMGLVVVERDLGGAVMFVPIVLGMVLVAGVRWRVLLATVAVALVVGGVAWNFFMLDYQRQRVLTFMSPSSDPLGAGYQLRQSKIAVGSGGLNGRGYMQGTQSQLRFLPARHTDFVFAVLAEEWGFAGVLVVVALYTWFVLSAVKIAQRARDRAGILLVVGLLSGFAFHVLYNTAMVVGLVPITGIPLPFVSYGGTFLLTSFVAMGIMLGVDFRRHVNR